MVYGSIDFVLACNYANRVLRVTRSFPALLLWLAYSPANQPCEFRRSCASDCLDFHRGTGPATEECDTTKKFCSVFTQELTVASSTGCIAQYVYDFIKCLGENWLPDTQIIQGANNTIKGITTSAPAIHWELMSSRVTVKHNGKCGSIGQGRSTRDDRERLVQRCVDNHAELLKSELSSAAGVQKRFETVSRDSYPLPINRKVAEPTVPVAADKKTAVCVCVRCCCI